MLTAVDGCGTAKPTGFSAESANASDVSDVVAVASAPVISGSEFAVNEQTVEFFGRHHIDVQSMAYGFTNVASGFSFTFTGSSLELELSSAYYMENNLNYVAIYVDDRAPVSFAIEKQGWYTVAADLGEGTHTVRVVKRTQANDGAVFAHNVRLSEGATAQKTVTDRTRRIQVLGDSISCAYGIKWDGTETEEISKWQDGSDFYATMLADRLHAQLEVIAIGGIGVGNAENNPYPILPHYKQQDMYDGVDCDYSRYVPDVVVVALGTNDAGHNDGDVFVNNGVRLLRFIREQYPDACILWTYGVMGTAGYFENIEKIVRKMNDGGDSNVYSLFIKPRAGEPLGQHGHPGYQTHHRMAEELAAYITQLTGWTEN